MKFIVIFVILPNKQVKQLCKALLSVLKLAIKKVIKLIVAWLSDQFLIADVQILTFSGIFLDTAVFICRYFRYIAI